MVQITQNNIDVILISETKFNSSFPISQSEIEGYTKIYGNEMQKGRNILLRECYV